SLVSPDDQKRMNLFRNRPFWRSATPKKTVNKFNWTINRSGPPAIEHSRIVKNYRSAGPRKTAPVLPIPYHSGLSVISIDQNQINDFLPVACRVLAEFLDPHHFPARAAVDSSLRHTSDEIEYWNAAQVEWINQIERTLLGHSFAKCQRRNSLGNSDFNHALASVSPFSERRVLLRGVL